MFCIGLTGNIGSGKSTVAKYFKALGVDIINADQIARTLTLNDTPAFREIVQHFGKSILTPQKELNRPHLRELIFNNEQERLWLENLLHPLIRQQIEQDITKVTSPYCIIEIPLLTNKARYPYLNHVLLVKTQENQQLARLVIRDNSAEKDIRTILAIQKKNEAAQMAIADDIILNTGTEEALKQKVEVLHKRYLQER